MEILKKEPKESKDLPEQERIEKKELLQPFSNGYKVRVQRSNGEMEDDWVILQYNGENDDVIVVKKDLKTGDTLKKEIPFEEIRKFNPKEDESLEKFSDVFFKEKIANQEKEINSLIKKLEENGKKAETIYVKAVEIVKEQNMSCKYLQDKVDVIYSENHKIGNKIRFVKNIKNELEKKLTELNNKMKPTEKLLNRETGFRIRDKVNALGTKEYEEWIIESYNQKDQRVEISGPLVNLGGKYILKRTNITLDEFKKLNPNKRSY